MRRSWVPGTALVAVALLGAACGRPDYHYVKSTSDRTFVRVPEKWTLFDEDEVLSLSDESPEAKAQFKRLNWAVAFDAAPRPSLEHLLSASEHPTGLVQAQTMGDERRRLSFGLPALRSVLLGFDPLENDTVEVVRNTPVKRPGGLNGQDLLLNIRLSDGAIIRFRQVALADSSFRKVHVLAISCSTQCFEANEKVIDQVVASWKIKER